MFNRLHIELENDTVRYIYGSIAGGKINIRNWGMKHLMPGCFVNGKVADEAEFTRALTELKKEIGKIRGSVHLTVNDGSFITRPVELPVMKDKDIEKHLSMEAEQYLPINSSDFQMSFRTIGRNTKDEEPGNSVMVSAGPRESISNILKCFDSCKLNVKLMDVYPNNICRLLRQPEENDYAVVDMRRNNVNITIFEDRKFYMHSYLPVNFEALFDEYIKDNGIIKDEFLQEYFYGSYSFVYINQDETEMEEKLRENLSGTLRQITRYLDYFNSRHFGKTVDNVYIIGENGMLKGLKDVLGVSFNTKVTIGLEAFDMRYSIVDRAFLREQLGYYGILGMMLRGKSR
ncbi:MAG TPA: pilus assembly protein PilM [Clostridia bacterium]|nr:pilus assembly protein PilM [Clostridia bacterium]